MTGIYVTGTDTGVGKTVITGLLGRYLKETGYRVITQKWIETGVGKSPSDIDLHLRLIKMQKKDIKDYLPYVSCYTFRFASSPHLAASLEKRRVRTDRIKKSFRFLSKRFDFVIVEGLGGALVPLSGKRLVIDIAKELGLPVLVVAGNKLGAINHTVLTVEAIKKRGMKIVGIIFNNLYKRGDKIILRDNPRIIKRLTGEVALGTLAHSKDKELLYKTFAPIGKRIITEQTRDNRWIAG